MAPNSANRRENISVFRARYRIDRRRGTWDKLKTGTCRTKRPLTRRRFRPCLSSKNWRHFFSVAHGRKVAAAVRTDGAAGHRLARLADFGCEQFGTSFISRWV
jgi:hypothetical protein